MEQVCLKRSDKLWPWYGLTLIYLGLGALVLYDRWGEVGSLFEPPGTTPGRLPLNSIGDILAGFFAPLAFLWLFVATQLQRKELRLQREELADTRRVLSEQKSEMQRSAEESNLQTSIMQRNLDTANAKQIYDEYSLKMYFEARSIYADKNCTLQYLKYSRKYPVYDEMDWCDYSCRITNFSPSIYLSPTDASTIDGFIEAISQTLKDAEYNTANPQETRILYEAANHSAWIVLIKVIAFVDGAIANADIHGNELIKLRVQNLELAALRNTAKALKERFEGAPDTNTEASATQQSLQ